MKKIVLILGTLVLFYGTSYGAIIAFDNITSDAGFTYDTYNTPLNTLYNELNGAIASENIQNGTIVSDDIAASASPLIRENETIGEFVYTGLTLPTSGTFSSSAITAGTAYVTQDSSGALHRVVTSAYTIGTSLEASKDNWIYLSYTGEFSVTAQNVGVAQPTTPADSILLGKIVTGATDVSSADETSRATQPPAMRIYADYKNGCVIQRTAAQTVTVYRGEIDFGAAASNGRRRNTTSTTVDFSTTGRGALDADSQIEGVYYFIWAYPDPDNETGFECLASLSSTDPGTVTDVSDERIIGWVYSDGASTLSADSVGALRTQGGDAPNVCKLVSTPGDLAQDVTNSLGTVKFYSSGNRPVEIRYSVSWNGGGADADFATSISMDSGTTVIGSACYSDVYGASNVASPASSMAITCDVSAGPHEFELRQSANEVPTITNATIVVEEK